MAEYCSRLIKVLIAGVLCLFSIAAPYRILSISTSDSRAVSAVENITDNTNDASLRDEKSTGHTENAASGISDSEPAKSTGNSAPSANAVPQAGTAADIDASYGGTIRCLYYDRNAFIDSVISAKKKSQQLNEKLDGSYKTAAGGIVPHHLLAGDMIAGFFDTLSKSSPETIVVIAPNHNRAGLTGIHVCPQSWSCEYGTLDADTVLTKRLINEFGARSSSTLMENDHSISALVPYIKYYMPDVKIVPVLLHGNYSADDSIKLGNLLAEEISQNPRIVVVASVDFSHYLDAQTAFKMDEQTLEAIASNDIKAISMMGNDNLDSPPSIIALLTAMSKNETYNLAVLDHNISSNYTNSGFDYTTSYFTMLFY